MSLNLCITLLIVITSEAIPYSVAKVLGLEDEAMYYWVKANMLPFYGMMIILECATLYFLDKNRVFWVTTALIVGVSLRLFLHATPLIGYWLVGIIKYLESKFGAFDLISSLTLGRNVGAYIDGYYYAIIQLLVILQVFVFGISPWLDDRRFHTDSSAAF